MFPIINNENLSRNANAFALHLKEQLNHFVDSYSKYLFKTYAVTMTLTVLFYIAAAFLIDFDKNDSSVATGMKDLISLLFYRYSLSSYRIMDFGASFAFFFIAVFSLCLSRFESEVTGGNGELTFGRFITKISFEEVVVLAAALAICCLWDYLLFQSYKWFSKNNPDEALSNYYWHVVFVMRIYLPLIIYAITIYKLRGGALEKIGLGNIFFVFIAAWMFHELAFELYFLIKRTFYDLFLLHFSQSDFLILYQSFLDIPLMGFLFTGYFSAMTFGLKVEEREPSLPAEEDEPIFTAQ